MQIKSKHIKHKDKKDYNQKIDKSNCINILKLTLN